MLLESMVSVVLGLIVAFYFEKLMSLLIVALFPLAIVGRYLRLKYGSGKAVSDAKDMENSGKVGMIYCCIII